MKPIRVFYSTLSQRFYAMRAWKEITLKNGRRVIESTGERTDVTNDIAWAIKEYGITFRKKPIKHSFLREKADAQLDLFEAVESPQNGPPLPTPG